MRRTGPRGNGTLESSLAKETKMGDQMNHCSPRMALLVTSVLVWGGEASCAAGEQLRAACPTLAGRVISAASIGLPSGDVSIASAKIVNATSTPPTPDFCKVLGSIAPIDPAAQLINFQINLPIAWNGKAVQYGGGGYNGPLITGLAPLRAAPPDDPLPLTPGYVAFGTDSGPQASAF